MSSWAYHSISNRSGSALGRHVCGIINTMFLVSGRSVDVYWQAVGGVARNDTQEVVLGHWLALGGLLSPMR